jgi:hypothetical protein
MDDRRPDDRNPDDRKHQARGAPRGDIMRLRPDRAGLGDEHVRHCQIQ